MIQNLYKHGAKALAGAALLGIGYFAGVKSQDTYLPQVDIQTDTSQDASSSARDPTKITLNHNGATYTAVLRSTDRDSETIEQVELSGRFGSSTLHEAFQPEKVRAFENLQNSLDTVLKEMAVQ